MTRLAKPHGPRTAAASSAISRRPARRPRPRHQPNLPTGKHNGRHRRHRQFPGDVHPIHRFRIRIGPGRCALARRRSHRHRHHARRSLLGDGARRGRARTPHQEDALYRRLRLHHRQLQQPRADHLQQLRRARHRSGRRHHQRLAASSARQDRRGRDRRRQADPHRDLRDDGFHQRLREPGADHHPARRLADRHHQLLRHGDPALRQPDRVQADDTRRVCSRPLRPLRPHRVSRRARARQRRLVRHQDPGARRHHRHRLDDLQSVHQRLQQSADDLRRADTHPGGALAARPHDLRSRHRQRPDRRRPATRRRRCGRHRSRGGGHRRRWNRSHGGRTCRRGWCDRGHGARGRLRRGRRHRRLSRRRRDRCRSGRRVSGDEPASPRGGQPERELRIGRARRDARKRASERRRCGILDTLQTARRPGRSA